MSIWENKRKKEPTPPDDESRFEANEWTLRSETSEVDKVVDAVHRRLAALGWSSDEIGNFPVAVGEAVANAIIHGNLGLHHEEGESKEFYDNRVLEAGAGKDAERKFVVAKLDLKKDEAYVSVSDSSGGASRDFAVPDSSGADGGLMEPTGRGIEMMRNICDKIAFLPGKVILIKRRTRPAS